MSKVTLWLWRHPRCPQAAGRCIGQTDLPVDRRRAKRLAHRMRAVARRERLPRVVWTSPLERCHAVGRWLRRWGWRHLVDTRLCELHFGRWEGQPWASISHAEVAAWEADFFDHAPGGGESLRALMARVRGFAGERADGAPVVVVAHAGWMQALAWQLDRHGVPCARAWPAPPRHGALVRLQAAFTGANPSSATAG